MSVTNGKVRKQHLGIFVCLLSFDVQPLNKEDKPDLTERSTENLPSNFLWILLIKPKAWKTEMFWMIDVVINLVLQSAYIS